MTIRNDIPAGFTLRHVIETPANTGKIAWSPTESLLAILSGFQIDIWNADTKQLQQTITSKANIHHISWAPNGRVLTYITTDNTIVFWDIHKRKAIVPSPLAGYDTAQLFMWSPSGTMLVTSDRQGHVDFWMWYESTEQFIYLRGFNRGMINCWAWSPDERLLATVGKEHRMYLWSTLQGDPLQSLPGHSDDINAIAWFPHTRHLLASGSNDCTIRLFWIQNAETSILEGHTTGITNLCFSHDGCFLASLSLKGTIHLHRTDTWDRIDTPECQEFSGSDHSDWWLGSFLDKVAEKLAFHPHAPTLAIYNSGRIYIWELDSDILLNKTQKTTSVHYTNAKVVLVGESAAGKSGLSLALTRQPFVPTDSTHGRRVWLFHKEEVENEAKIKEQHEILLWDLAGQPDYRLIHQLHLNQATIALLVFDASRETETFANVHYWNRALRQAQGTGDTTAQPLKKFLVAARLDRGGINVSMEHIKDVVYELGCAGFFATSAKEGWNIGQLAQAIYAAIDWKALPKVISTELFQQIKQFLLATKQEGQLLHTTRELYHAFLRSKDRPPETQELPMQFDTCLRHVESGGLIRRLSFGDLVLLQPELLDTYASGLLITVKNEADGLGTIAEERVKQGQFYVPPEDRLKRSTNEQLLLIAMIEELILQELVLREGENLIFPSQFSLETTDLVDPKGKAASITFEGPILSIYTTLVVRLSHSRIFQKQALWKNAVTYTTVAGGTYGLFLDKTTEDRAELLLFFDPTASKDMRFHFEEFIVTHIQQYALPESVQRKQLFVCTVCGIEFTDTQVTARRQRGLDWLTCVNCDARVSLLSRDEQFVTLPVSRSQEMQREADTQRDRAVAQSQLEGKLVTQDFDVFLCYNPVDRVEVKKIAQQLQEWGILPWLDEWELRPGQPWQRELEKHIEHIRTAAVFIDNDESGPWEQLETEALLQKFVKRGCPIIPVILQQASHEPQLPAFLNLMTRVDFREQDPVPLEQLIWGITGKRITTTGLHASST